MTDDAGITLLRAVEAMQKQLLEEVREMRKEAQEGREVRGQLDAARKANAERQAKWRHRNVTLRHNNVTSTVVKLDLAKPDQEPLKASSSRHNNVSHVTRPDTGPTRRAFEEAFQNRYGIEPTWNTTTNSQMARFVKRIGVEDSPAVAVFYVAHNSAEYVKKMHPVGRLLNDAEALHGQWQRGVQITATGAQQQDKTQENLAGWMGMATKGAK